MKGLITSIDIIKSKVSPNASKDDKGRLIVGAAIGVKGDYLKRAEELVNVNCDVLVLDIAHGHSDLALNAVNSIRKDLGDVELIAGNVATAEGTKALIEAECDAVKTGSNCSIKTLLQEWLYNLCISRNISKHRCHVRPDHSRAFRDARDVYLLPFN